MSLTCYQIAPPCVNDGSPARNRTSSSTFRAWRHTGRPQEISGTLVLAASNFKACLGQAFYLWQSPEDVQDVSTRESSERLPRNRHIIFVVRPEGFGPSSEDLESPALPLCYGRSKSLLTLIFVHTPLFPSGLVVFDQQRADLVRPRTRSAHQPRRSVDSRPRHLPVVPLGLVMRLPKDVLLLLLKRGQVLDAVPDTTDVLILIGC